MRGLKSQQRARSNSGVWFALVAAVLFGASTPFSKVLLVNVSSVLLAGLLYLGSGIGLAVWQLVRLHSERTQSREASLKVADLPWLAGAILSGGGSEGLSIDHQRRLRSRVVEYGFVHINDYRALALQPGVDSQIPVEHQTGERIRLILQRSRFGG